MYIMKCKGSRIDIWQTLCFIVSQFDENSECYWVIEFKPFVSVCYDLNHFAPIP